MSDINKTRKDAIDQAVTWMRAAVREIDAEFAKPGYAQAHPELVAALVTAAALDQQFIGIHDLSASMDGLAQAVDDSNH